MNDPIPQHSVATVAADAPPTPDLRPHVIAYLANNLGTNGYEHHARTMEALADLRASDKPVGKVVLFGEDLKEVSWRKGRLPPVGTDLYAAPQASAEGVRQGWKLVPVEPTESMVVAGFESAPDAHFSPREEWVRYEAMTGCQQAAHRARLCWAAMLAAAPAAEDSAKGAGDVALPRLPRGDGENIPFFTRVEMKDYARAAVLADRQQRGGDVHEPIAWESTTPAYIKYITDGKYRKFSQAVRQWYRPYRCSTCAALAAPPVADDAMERALTELVDKIVPGLDTGDLVADARTASKALDRAQPAAIAEPSDGEIEALAHRVCMKYTHADDPSARRYEFGMLTLRQFARKLLDRYGRPAGDAQPVALTEPQRDGINWAVRTLENRNWTGDLYLAAHLRRLLDTSVTALAAHKPDGGDAKDAERWRWLRDLVCCSLTLSRNDEHACNYMTAEKWIRDFPEHFADCDPAEVERMMATNTIWRLQIYPNTPVGFNVWHGATLEAAIDAAISAQQGQEGK